MEEPGGWKILETFFLQTDALAFQHTPALNQSFVLPPSNIKHIVNIAWATPVGTKGVPACQSKSHPHPFVPMGLCDAPHSSVADNRRSIDRTVLAICPNCLATWRIDALSSRQPHGILKIFAERRFARQLRNLLDLYPTLRTAHPVQFDDHRGLILPPRQLTHLALVIIMGFGPSASRTDQFTVGRFPSHP
jgi:hypothetical protein